MKKEKIDIADLDYLAGGKLLIGEYNKPMQMVTEIRQGKADKRDVFIKTDQSWYRLKDECKSGFGWEGYDTALYEGQSEATREYFSDISHWEKVEETK